MASEALALGGVLQHLIDPEICIRCGACEAACPIDAITHDDRNYVIKPDVCEGCMACITVCPTGAIDNWLRVPDTGPHALEAQFGWDALPHERDAVADEVKSQGALLASGKKPGGEPADAEAPAAQASAEPAAAAAPAVAPSAKPADAAAETPFDSAHYASKVPPWSASHAFSNLYGVKEPTIATIVSNENCTLPGAASETRHIVLDFGATPFPVLEGQTIGVIPPGQDANGRGYVAREYSVASSRSGEYRGRNDLSITVKRVTENHDGNPVRGVASNYLCDLQPGSEVQVIGPFGTTFLMPNHPGSSIVMICTGAGSAPMRAMTEWRRRLIKSGKFKGGKMILFYGARTPQELPYLEPLENLPKDLLDINFAFSREPGKPKRYVQDAMRARAGDLAEMIGNGDSYFYVCGLKAMEEGVLRTMAEIARQAGLNWGEIATDMRRGGRLQLETY
ncbi:MAG: benzoyl-CoA 2,3-epoxidase subunit BoxA [Burkholderiaceae bacterium]|nr:MAG: benzoyl-CoA 2,3-epoxidase subunit BoxA [Burkholderiaceae bacterium]